MKTKKSDELRNLAVELYAKLRNGEAVARKLELSSHTVYTLLHEARVELPDSHNFIEAPGHRKGLRGDAARAAAQDYADGMKLSDIMEKYNVGRWAIKTAARDAGVPFRPHGQQSRRIKDSDVQEIVRLYSDELMSQAQIAARFHTSQGVLSKVLRGQGIATRHSKNMVGPLHPSWTGGRARSGEGYIGVRIPDDDPLVVMRTRSGYIQEHRLVMARSLGRPLLDHETVHHINGDRTDNRLENLQLRTGKHGRGLVYRCLDCGSFHVAPVEIAES